MEKVASANRLQRPVTIIVPVFNAWESVVLLIKSMKATVKGHRNISVIFVDDASTDRRVPIALGRMAQQTPRCLVLLNPENLGYAASTQRAILRAPKKSDLIFLNSDTVVFGHWVHSLQQAAYESKKIASVSPLTNNSLYASILNWPYGAQMTVDRARRFASRLKHLQTIPNSIEVPATFGFCMYVRRAALDQVGLFDSQAFPRGYGEELDWCFRASKMGYSHRLTAKTFVYHRGTQSFTLPERKRYNRRSQNILAFLHPEQLDLYQKHFCSQAFANWIRLWSQA